MRLSRICIRKYSRIPDADALNRIDRFLKGQLHPTPPTPPTPQKHTSNEKESVRKDERESTYDSFVYPPKYSETSENENPTLMDSITGSSKKIIYSATNLASDVATNVTEKSVKSAIDTIQLISQQVNDENIDVSVSINIGILNVTLTKQHKKD